MTKYKLESLEYFSTAKDILTCPKNAEFWCRVKNKLELIYLLLTCMQHVIYNEESRVTNTDNKLILNDNNSFYIDLHSNTHDSTKRIVSISSPFKFYGIDEKKFVIVNMNESIEITGEKSVFLKKIIKELARKDSSEIQSISELHDLIEGFINEEAIIKEKYNENEDYLIELQIYLHQVVYFLLKTEILFTRIDDESEKQEAEKQEDNKTGKRKSRKKKKNAQEEHEKTHPPIHIDFTTETHSQFKLGLSRNISCEEYIEISDVGKTCYFLKH